MGTFGLAAVLLRNILERRSELALLWALGYRHRQIVWLVVAENALLLLWGLAIGGVCAMLALAPGLAGGISGVPWRSIGGVLGLVLLTGLGSAALVAWTAVGSAGVADLRGD
ncbi:MAG: hypothetical protein IID54_06390 [Proteobacteria bacterium]|nr:hypothetical protein [Pseudomonadota bacterium]